VHTQLWRNGKRYRYFNNRPYEHLGWYSDKADAFRCAGKARQEGKWARVTSDHINGFAVWTCTQTGGGL
jgi:hypothetical protein